MIHEGDAVLSGIHQTGVGLGRGLEKQQMDYQHFEKP